MGVNVSFKEKLVGSRLKRASYEERMGNENRQRSDADKVEGRTARRWTWKDWEMKEEQEPI